VQNIINTQDRLIKRDAEIVEARLNGATYDDLARRYEISNSSISRILNKREVKDVLDTALNHLVSFAPIVVRNYRTLLESKDARVRQKATDAMAKILGLTPSHTPAQINALFVQNNSTTIISDKMREIIDQISGNHDFVDAEFTAILGD